MVVCPCGCHASTIADRWRVGVWVEDVIEAAVACDTCLHLHCPALLGQGLANDPPLIQVVSVAQFEAWQSDGEGAE